MKIVVTTPTGHIGSRVVQLLIQAGVRPTIIARDPARLAPEVREASDVRQGDLTDLDFVLQTTEGADALFWLIPTNYASADPVGDIVRVGQNAAEAIQKNNIARTVFLSSAGADRRGGDFISALGRVEDLLNATNASVTHLRPGFFFTNLFMGLEELKQGLFFTTVPLDIPMPWNDPRDVGEIAAARLLATDWTGQSVQEIQGPQHLTFGEVSAIVTEATGHKVETVRISDDELRQALLRAGLGAPSAEAYVEMMGGLTEGQGDWRPRTFVTTTPTTLGAWSYANLRPALAGN